MKINQMVESVGQMKVATIEIEREQTDGRENLSHISFKTPKTLLLLDTNYGENE